jgi:pyruvate ferredoxin oxidoreductase alpha subunit
MRKQIEGSWAVAEAVALCRPQVICAYPITPQTHIVEALSEITSAGDLSPCEFINVESEFAALSVAIGASAGGARAYTATSSQGLLFMTEAVYNASGLGLPIVMTIGNRAIGAPINIWNDHSDSMSVRDAGWIQLHADTNQEAVDLHIQAFRLAEAISRPVMVCMDGFVLTHAVEAVDIPEQADVDNYLPKFSPHVFLDPASPITIGALVGPEAFTEVQYLADRRFRSALELIPRIAAEFRETFGRASGGLIGSYRVDDADLIVVALGSANGTIQDVVDELRNDGVRAGSISVRCYRPFPYDAVRAAAANAKELIVLDRSVSPGSEGPLLTDVRTALSGSSAQTFSLVAGLGGRPITNASLRATLNCATAGLLAPVTYLDLNESVIRCELQRDSETRNEELVI